MPLHHRIGSAVAHELPQLTDDAREMPERSF